MQIAIISSGNLDDMKGIMNYVHEKTSRLRSYTEEEMNVDVFLLHQCSTKLFSILQKSRNNIFYSQKPLKTSKNGIVYNEIWYKYGLIDSLFTSKILGRPINKYYERRIVPLFKQYDIIVSHNPICHYLAMRIRDRYGTPIVATWHGSDINIFPKVHRWQYNLVKRELKSLDMNLFVSKALLKNSNMIVSDGSKDVIYTGPSSFFYEYSDQEKLKCREKYAKGKLYSVGYVGNLIPVKNVLVLPQIFKRIESEIGTSNVAFIVAGGGGLSDELKEKLCKVNVDVNMLGNISPLEVVEVMNSLDVLILPSIHEGLGLVVLEAYKCGANVVGSNIGGIPEAVGQPENVFDLNDTFIENISNRIIKILIDRIPPRPYDSLFSWDAAVEKEVGIYKKLLGKLKSDVMKY